VAAERRAVRRVIVTGCLLGLLSAPGLIGSQEQAPEPAPPDPAAAEPAEEIPPPAVEYRVQITGDLT
jgi:hypothetical protein